MIGVIGLGQVGLPLALEFTHAGYNVVGIDIDESRVSAVRDDRSYIRDVDNALVAEARDRGFAATTDYAALSDASLVSICVPTPLQKTGKPDVSYVRSAAEEVAEVVNEQCTVVLESTVYPGGTREIVTDVFDHHNMTVGEDVFVAFSPERVNPGDEQYGLADIPKVLGGVTPACGDRAQAVYEDVFETIHRVDSAAEAEMTKILENSFRSVNIALVNELAQVASDLGVDIWNVIEAAETKPFGFLAFYPGPGLGGHCIPVDPLYLSWKASKHGYSTNLIDTADKINRQMPEFVMYRLIELLAEEGTDLNESKIHVAGVTYKPDVPDTRESPAVDIIKLLNDREATVTYSDPYIESLTVGSKQYEAVEATEEVLAAQDVVVVVTDHSTFDPGHFVACSPLLLDTRNMTDGYDEPHVVCL
jgi:UDP-N-acetyl-D-glucosamine dehydrogenase